MIKIFLRKSQTLSSKYEISNISLILLRLMLFFLLIKSCYIRKRGEQREKY